MKRDPFSSCHPAVTMLYFVLVIGFSMFLMHPVCLGLSLVSALLYAIRLSGRRAIRLSLFGNEGGNQDQGDYASYCPHQVDDGVGL